MSNLKMSESDQIKMLIRLSNKEYDVNNELQERILNLEKFPAISKDDVDLKIAALKSQINIFVEENINNIHLILDKDKKYFCEYRSSVQGQLDKFAQVISILDIDRIEKLVFNSTQNDALIKQLDNAINHDIMGINTRLAESEKRADDFQKRIIGLENFVSQNYKQDMDIATKKLNLLLKEVKYLYEDNYTQEKLKSLKEDENELQVGYLSFADAFKWLKQGCKIKREIWCDSWLEAKMADDDYSDKGDIFISSSEVSSTRWFPTIDQLDGDDWLVLNG